MQILVFISGWIDGWLDHILAGLEDLYRDVKQGFFD
jgi:hypothetical protein